MRSWAVQLRLAVPPQIEQRLPRRHRVQIRIGAPLDFSCYRDHARTRPCCPKLTNEVMAAIAWLAGQSWVASGAAPATCRAPAAGIPRQAYPPPGSWLTAVRCGPARAGLE